MELSKEFRFEASHILPRHPGKCSRLHGHSWVLRVFVQGPINKETGFVQDYADISAAVKPLVERLDHRHLGTFNFRFSASYPPVSITCWAPLDFPEDFYPSSENLLIWIGEDLLGEHAGENPDYFLNWSKLELEETCTSKAILTREEFDGLQR